MTLNHAFDILVAGELNPDLILTGNVTPEFGQVEKLVDSAALAVGSPSAIFACGAARLGLRVAFVGVCGADIFGRFMLDELSRAGVDVSGVIIDPALKTGLSVILNRPRDGSPDERAILIHSGAIHRLRVEQVTQEILQKARHLHISSYFLQTALQPDLSELFQRARALDLTTSLCIKWEPSSEWGRFNVLPDRVDVFLPDEKAALAISGASNLEAALQILSQKNWLVAVKCRQGGALASQGKECVRAPALPVQVVNSTGAEASFDAGFLYGWLNGWSLERNLALATTCGSLSSRAAGGTSTQPTLDEAMQYAQFP